MKDPTALPLALYRANSELQSRLAELVQDSALMWLEFGQRMINEGMVDDSSDVQEMLRTQDWQKLLSLPADAFWRQLQQRFGDHQAALANGGKDNGAPGERPYHPGYYAAFALDPDGNNIEVVFHGPATYSADSVKVSFEG